MELTLRPYIKSDSGIIAGWIKSEKALYQWSADRINKFPIAGKDIDSFYSESVKGGRFFPLTAIGDSGAPVGHLIIRYPEDDSSVVRFGFVIVDDKLRGQGTGKQLLKAAIAYARDTLHASLVTLGVFANNDSAFHCYKSVGFAETGTDSYSTTFGEWECIEMEYAVK